MRKYFSFLILIVFVHISCDLFAQRKTEIMGRVLDSIDKKGIPFASIRLLDTVGNLQNGTMSDTTGFFKMAKVPRNTYILEVSCLGYKTKKLHINANESQVYYKINLVVNTKMLEEAVVTGERITMREEIDKMVYKIDDFTLHNSTTALEALKIIPSVTVKTSDETIKVNGSSNVLVLVDGAYSTRSLSSITPEDIESIEIISNPSVEYDSDVANVVNIVMKEERKKGLRVVASVKATYPDQHDNVRIAADFEFSKFRLFTDYQFTRFVLQPIMFVFDSTYYKTWDEDNIYETSSSREFLKSPPHLTHKVKYGFNYRISKNDFLNFTGSYSFNKSESSFNSFSLYQINGDTIYNQTENDFAKSETPEQNYTLFYRHRFDDKGHEISLNTNLYMMKRNGWNTFNSTFAYPDESVEAVNMSRILYNKQTTFNAKLKYDLPITEKLKTSIGFQSFYRTINYSYDDSLHKQYFDYNDTRIAGFAQFSYSFNEKLSVMAGLRCENLKFNIYDTLDCNQLNWLPNASALYKFNKNNSIRLNYKTLLTYPSYHFLTPFVYTDTDSLMYSAGNPELLPTKTQNIALQYAYRKSMTNIIVGPYFAFQNGIIGETRQIDGSITNVKYGNIANSKKIGGRVGATMLIGGFLVPMFDFDFGYVSFDDNSFDGWEYSIDAGLEMELPWDITLEAYMSYSGMRRVYNGYSYETPLIDEISISKDFSNNLMVQVSVDNVFLSFRDKEIRNGFDYYEKTWSETRFPTVSLFIRYVFTAGSRKITHHEDLESLMENEENVENRK